MKVVKSTIERITVTYNKEETTKVSEQIEGYTLVRSGPVMKDNKTTGEYRIVVEREVTNGSH